MEVAIEALRKEVQQHYYDECVRFGRLDLVKNKTPNDVTLTDVLFAQGKNEEALYHLNFLEKLKK